MMKSERRHELATNELADWIVNFPQWLNENKTTVVVGAIIVVGLIAYTIFFYSRESRVYDARQSQAAAMLEQVYWQKETVLSGKVQGLGVSDIFLNTAGSLKNVAQETDNPNLSALAMIKRAEVLRAELHYRPKIAEKDVQAYQLQEAKKIYTEALGKADMPVVSAMAEYGIALCLEDMGDFDGAKTLYNKIADSNEYQGTSFSARAKLRTEVMADYEGKFAFSKTASEVQPKAEPLKLETPMSGAGIKMQEPVDFNLAK
jgi:tetratricopeptide (TPR) repeat protein